MPVFKTGAINHSATSPTLLRVCVSLIILAKSGFQGRVVIQSVNEQGAAEMKRWLPRAEPHRFGSFEIESEMASYLLFHNQSKTIWIVKTFGNFHRFIDITMCKIGF